MSGWVCDDCKQWTATEDEPCKCDAGDAGESGLWGRIVARQSKTITALAAQLAAALVAKEEACDIAARVIADAQNLPSTDSGRIAELRAVGGAK